MDIEAWFYLHIEFRWKKVLLIMTAWSKKANVVWLKPTNSQSLCEADFRVLLVHETTCKHLAAGQVGGQREARRPHFERIALLVTPVNNAN